MDDAVFSRVEHVLDQRGISLKQLSRELELPYRSIQNWASGRSTLPTDVLRRISVYLGIEADYFLFGGIDLDKGALRSVLRQILGPVLDAIEISEDGELRNAPRTPDSDMREAVIEYVAAELREGYLLERFQLRMMNERRYSAIEGRADTARRRYPG